MFCNVVVFLKKLELDIPVLSTRFLRKGFGRSCLDECCIIKLENALFCRLDVLCLFETEQGDCVNAEKALSEGFDVLRTR